MKGTSLFNFNKNSNSDKTDILVLAKLVFLFIFSLFSSGILTQNIDSDKISSCFNTPGMKLIYLLILTSGLFGFTLTKPYEHFSEMVILSVILYAIIYFLELQFPKETK